MNKLYGLLSHHIKLLLVMMLVIWCSMASVLAQEIEDDGTQFAYVSPDETLRFTYPSTWTLINDEGRGLTLVSTPRILERREAGYDNLFADETLLSLRFVATNTLEAWGIAGENAEERLSNFSQSFSPNLTLGEIETVDGLSRIPVSLRDEFEGYAIIWDVSDDLTGFAVMFTAPGNLETATMAVNDILLSTQFNSTVEALLSAQEEANDE